LALTAGAFSFAATPVSAGFLLPREAAGFRLDAFDAVLLRGAPPLVARLACDEVVFAPLERLACEVRAFDPFERLLLDVAAFDPFGERVPVRACAIAASFFRCVLQRAAAAQVGSLRPCAELRAAPCHRRSSL
jgi:hypothetical protein